MQASQLRLDQYYIEELRFSLDDDYQYEEMDKEPRLTAEDLDVEVQPFRNPDNPLEWYFKLRVQLDDKNGKFPYVFSIQLAGFFEISDDCPEDMIEPLALINAPSILYAAAREILVTTTARSRYLSVFLPTVRFFGPPPTKAVEASQQKRITSGSTKTRNTSRSRKVAGKKK